MMNKTTTIRNILVMAVFLTVVVSCGGEKTILRADLNLAIRLSGDNRPELEKVLKHYSKNEKDSLKLKAAKFLISNMIRHYSFAGEYMEKHIAAVDSIYAEEPSIIKTLYYMIPYYSGTVTHELKIEPDLLHIKSDFLIDNIEKSFRLWGNMGYESTLSFNDFCEYILPYRISNEPLISWKDSIDNYTSDYLKNNQLEMISFNKYVDFLYSSHYYASERNINNRQFKNYFPSCREAVNNRVFVKRSLGIPAVVDYVPHHAVRNGRHYWVTMIDKRMRENTNNDDDTEYAAKVYRRTYSINPVPIDNKNFVPELMRDPYNKDVTEIYENVTDLKYRFKNKPSGVKFGYLAVFNSLNWEEVAWAKFDGEELIFDRIGRSIIYMPIYYDREKRVMGQYPVRVDPKGQSHEIIPNKEKTQDLILTRKYSYNVQGDAKGKLLEGMLICGSNDLQGMKFDTIATITHYRALEYDTVNTNNQKKYKHWLFMKPDYRHVIVSELEFCNEDNHKLSGEGFMIDDFGKIMTDGFPIPKFFDNDLLSNSPIRTAIGMSFKDPVSVSSVRYIASCDENGIYPENEYELLYFDKGNWESLGRMTATDYSIKYENAPTNALFWLRNHTKGNEERPFTVNNGKIKFW